MKTLGNNESGAVFSDDMKYRYQLWRCWDPTLPRVCFCLLNPSTADEIKNDATVERQHRRIIQWRLRGLRMGAIEIVNIFALRATDPQELYTEDEPIGPYNDYQIMDAVWATQKSKGLLICGWGGHALLRDRHSQVLGLLTMYTGSKLAFKLNGDGTPKHPLYIGYNVLPKLWIDDELTDHDELELV